MNGTISQDEIKRIQDAFIHRCLHLKIAFESNEYYNMQQDFFVGASVALNREIPYWSICVMTRRPIVELNTFETI